MKSQIPRFCPGCTQRKLQMNAAPCEICGRINAVEAPSPRQKVHFSVRILRALLAPLGRIFHVFTALFCAFALWSMALHGVLPFLGFVSLGLFFSGFIVLGIWTIRFITRGAVWVFAPATRQNKRPGARTFLVLPVCLAVLWVLNRFDVPLRIAFRLSLPALRKMPFVGTPNLGLGVGRNFNPTQRIGLYRAERFDVRGPNVRFHVSDNEFLWSGTKAGFAKCPGGCKANQFPPAYMRGEEPKYIQLSRDWFWWEESGTDD